MCVSTVRRWTVDSAMKAGDDVDVDDGDVISEHGVLGHFVAIFTFSFLVGLVILHTSILWQRMQYGDGFYIPERNMEQVMARYYGFDYYYDMPRRYDLAVNTTYFMH